MCYARPKSFRIVGDTLRVWRPDLLSSFNHKIKCVESVLVLGNRPANHFDESEPPYGLAAKCRFFNGSAVTFK